MLSAIMLISIYDNSTWDVMVMRSLSVGFFTFLVFYMNAYIIIYFKSKDNSNKSFIHVEQRIFVTGYICTILILALQHLFVHLCGQAGFDLHAPKHIQDTTGVRRVFLIAFISLIQYTFIYLIQNFTMSQYEKNVIAVQLLRLKSSNTETTNQLLKQQIQPHFLFNALNTLKSLIHKSPATAEDYLINLSDFLRASFTHSHSGLSSVEDELTICSNYMKMQKIRFGNALQYEVDEALFHLDIQTKLPVFSLQPLLENAIKHNIATVEDPLIITVTLKGDHICVTNNLQIKKSMTDSTGYGLSNLKERYRLLSEDDVIIEQTDKHFAVCIKMLKK